MSNDRVSRNSYLSKNRGEYPDQIEVAGRRLTKVDDLRYGTNPHQTAAYYRPDDLPPVIGGMEVLKTGKSGLSQTNLEDISYALNICKFFDRPACACMKHVNPSGAAVGMPGESLVQVYQKARDCDPRAAFGSVVAFNVPVTADVAREIMSTFVECVVAPEIDADALEVFNDQETYKLNRHIRVLKSGNLAALPRFVGDPIAGYQTLKMLADGSVVIADPLLTALRGVEDLIPASGSNKRMGEQESTVQASDQQRDDIVTAWYINLNVRSNEIGRASCRERVYTKV